MSIVQRCDLCGAEIRYEAVGGQPYNGYRYKQVAFSVLNNSAPTEFDVCGKEACQKKVEAMVHVFNKGRK
jgi:hypothetical protein